MWQFFILSSITYSASVKKLLGSKFEQNNYCKDLNLYFKNSPIRKIFNGDEHEFHDDSKLT